MTARILVVGGSGRVGRLLRAAWDQAPAREGITWQSRQAWRPADPIFDPISAPAAFAAVAAEADVVLMLAGVTRGDTAALAANSSLAIAALEAAAAAGCGTVFLASSAAVYGRPPSAADLQAPHDATGTGAALAEDLPPAPVAPYGLAKAEMERAVAQWCAAHPGGPRACILRIGNVAGADAVLGASGQSAPEPRLLDIFPAETAASGLRGMAPRRSYIGPVALAAALAKLADLACAGHALPPVLNVALPGTVGMDALLDAAGAHWTPRPAPAGAIPDVRLDTGRLVALGAVDARPATAAAIVADLACLRSGGAR